MRNNGNKSVLLLRSANNRWCIAVAKGDEENIGQKFIYSSCKSLLKKQESKKIASLLLLCLPDV